uniref:Uncharacterized protein n=2 Tax=Clastoptera arizonana TaxID=38151 RepID=A0A1B6EAN8_9HEMI
MMEVAIIGSDMQEVIGTAIAFYLLSNKGIPLWVGVLITVVDTLTFLFVDKFGIRKLEFIFGFLITVMAVTFGYEFYVVKPEGGEIVKGMLIPWCDNCDKTALLQAVGIIGAVIMPHNLYLHSGLVKSRAIDRKVPIKVREANRYFFIESAIAIAVSLVINTFVFSVFAHGLYKKTNADVLQVCLDNHSPNSQVFQNNTELVDVDIYTGGVYLGCAFGMVAMYIWAIGILAAGQSSTMTGCYAGQITMEGFLNLKWSRWLRVLVTRLCAIGPTFFVAFFNNIDDLSSMNDILNALMSLQLPFAVIPTIAFTSNKEIMGEFANGMLSKLSMTGLCAGIIGINIYFVVDLALNKLGHSWAWLMLLGSYCGFYIAICVVLSIHMFCNMASFPIENQFIQDFIGKVRYNRLEVQEDDEEPEGGYVLVY